jgi:hypothetical protein
MQDHSASYKKASRSSLLLQKLENLKIFPDPQNDPNNFYTVTHEITSDPFFSRYSCIHSPSQGQQELILFKKSSFYQSDYENLEISCEKLLNFPHENIVRVFKVLRTEGSFQVFTEVSGQKTLKDVLKNNRIPFGPALTFATQILKALMHLQKLGIPAKHLAETDVFLIKNSLKIAVSAVFFKESGNFLQEGETTVNPEVFTFGLVLIKLFIAPVSFFSLEEAFIRLEQLKIDPQDLKFIKKMMKSRRKQPTLREVSLYNWNTSCPSFFAKDFSKELNEIEKISEEASSSLLESWDFSNELESAGIHQVSKIEKSLVLATMESWTSN